MPALATRASNSESEPGARVDHIWAASYPESGSRIPGRTANAFRDVRHLQPGASEVWDEPADALPARPRDDPVHREYRVLPVSRLLPIAFALCARCGERES